MDSRTCNYSKFSCLIAACFILFFSENAASQNTYKYTRFQNIEPLKSIEDFPSKAKIYQTTSVVHLSKKSLETITLQLDQEESWTFDLHLTPMAHEQINIRILQENQSLIYSKPLPIKQYTGYLKNDPSTKIKLSLSPEGIEALIQFEETTLYLENLSKYMPSEQGLVVYNIKDQKNNNHKKCGQQVDIISKTKVPENTKSSNTCREIELSLALDFPFMMKHNQNIESAVQECLTALQMASLDYENQFDQAIDFTVKEFVISNCSDCDIWSSSTEVELLLDGFTHWASSGGFTENHDIGQLWSGKNLHKEFDFSFVGFAHNNGACSENRYHILEDIQLLNWQRRVLTSHEIGHNLGCNHDGGSSQTVMSPTLKNTTTWSTSSISKVNQFLQQNSCLTECQSSDCHAPTTIEIISFERDFIHLDWDQNTNGAVWLKIKNLSDGDFIIDTLLTSTSFIAQEIFPYCTDFEISLSSYCPNAVPISMIRQSSYENEIIISNVSTSKCLPGYDIGIYDLTIELVHQFEIGSEIFIEFGAYAFNGAVGNSPFVFTLEGLESSTSLETEIQIFQMIDGLKSCPVSETFYTPNQNCDLYALENFDSCTLPEAWSKYSDNDTYFPYPYDWKFDDNKRKIENYGKADNEQSSLTINGTCMAYFDDDINSNIEYTGTNVLVSPVYDISDYTNNQLSFEYIFHSFEDAKSNNESVFICQVWNGSAWINILQELQNTCPWSNVWLGSCVSHFSTNLDQFKNENFQVRFLYSDGNSGQWTGMIALDEFKLTGNNPIQFGCTDPSAINYDQNAVIDDQSCYSCTNSIQDGSETGIDCGGPDCESCIIPCGVESEEILFFTAFEEYTDIDTIVTSGVIDVPGVILKPGSSILFNPGFEINQGFEATISIVPCRE